MLYQLSHSGGKLPAVPIKHKALGANLSVHESWRAGPTMSDAPVRYRNTVLYDRGGQKVTGDVLLHADGSWSASNGDEDVVEDIDGSKRLITRSFQNWHTHLAMQFNARDFSDGFPLHRWLNEAIFPTEARITPDYVRMGSRCAAAEMIRTGSSLQRTCTFSQRHR